MLKKNGRLTKCHNRCYIDFSSKVYENIFCIVSQIIHDLLKYFEPVDIYRINVIRCGNTFYIKQ